MKKALFILLAGTSLFTACKKNDTSNASAKDKITGKWMLTAFSRTIFVGTNNSTVSRYDSLLTCERDDLYLFNADNTLTRDEGDQKCRSTDAQQRPLGSYAITNNDTRLVMPNPDNTAQVDTLEILELTGSTLRTQTVSNGSTSGIRDNKTYVKK